MNRPEELIKKIYEEQGQINDVFFTACGGSLVDLYPGFYFINAESETMHSHWLTAKELIVSPSKFLKKGALVILCSHGGNTNETVNAAKLAKERGAAVITMTHNPNSICAQEDMNPVVYSWEDDTNEKDKPQGIVLNILNELMKAQEPDYKLYDAVADGLTEDDFTTTSWEDSKGMINRGEIATMVLGSWAYSQMVDADSHGEDIGYMPFPITIDGKQYASAGADYSFGINAASDADHQAAAMVFVKWMTEESGFAYNEGGIPIAADDNAYPDAYAEFGDVTFVSDESALEGEEDLLNALNADSGLNINAGGKEKGQEIIEHASNGDMSYDDIMAEWNEKWTQAQEDNGVTAE